MTNGVVITQETIDTYVKDRVLRYFMDSGMTEKDAKKKIKSLSQKELNRIYDEEPYFEENGY